jgi:signal peptidase I
MIDGTSMVPTLQDGDLAVVRRSDSYRVGDIIAYHPTDAVSTSQAVVIHRIVGGSGEEGFLTQGDNRPGDDPWRPRPKDIVGSVWFMVPGAGNYVARLREPLVLAPLAAALTVFLVLMGGSPRDRKDPKLSRLSCIRRRRRPQSQVRAS